MATTATATIARPAGKGNGILAALLKAAINVLGAVADRQSAASASEIVEAPRSNDVDLWKLYWAAGSGANSPRVRQMLGRAGQ